MKRLLFLFFLALTWDNVVAEEYPFLNIEQANGDVTTYESTGVKFTFADGKLIVNQNGSQTSFTLTDLSKMYFSTTSGINSIDQEDEKSYDVISISGVKLGKFQDLSDMQNKLEKGVYIIKKGQQKYKITVK